MNEPHNYPDIGEEQVIFHTTEAPALDVVQTSVKMVNGQFENWRFVRQNHGIPGAVAIPVKDEHILIARQWRLTSGDVTVELPRGHGQPDESGVQTAIRELREETGISSRSAIQIGEIMPDTGLLNTRVAVVEIAVEDADHVGTEDHVPDGELESWQWVNRDEFESLVKDGTITDAISISAFTLWKLHSDH